MIRIRYRTGCTTKDIIINGMDYAGMSNEQRKITFNRLLNTADVRTIREVFAILCERLGKSRDLGLSENGDWVMEYVLEL